MVEIHHTQLKLIKLKTRHPQALNIVRVNHIRLITEPDICFVCLFSVQNSHTVDILPELTSELGRRN